MKNFPVIVDSKEYWISRSIACSIRVETENDNGRRYILSVKRGSAVDHPGTWCLPGGYLDYNETLEQCAVRELKEETGVQLNSVSLSNPTILSNPIYSAKQVVTALFHYKLFHALDLELTSKFSEPNEIEEIKWIPLDEIKNYNWMYNSESLHLFLL